MDTENAPPGPAKLRPEEPADAQLALTRELKRLIDASPMSQTRIGNLVSVHKSTVSRVARGDLRPNRTLAEALATVLDGDVEYIQTLWEAADQERRPTPQGGLIDVAEGDEREKLRAAAGSLNAERLRRKLSFRGLARTAYYSKSALAEIFQGKRAPDSALLDAILAAMNMNAAETRIWKSRFAQAAEALRAGRQAQAGQAGTLAPDIASLLVSLQKRLKFTQIGAMVAGGLAVLAGIVSVIAIMLVDGGYPSSNSSGSTYTGVGGRTTSITPTSPTPRTATVSVTNGSGLTVFDKPSITSAQKVVIPESTDVVVVCHVVTDTPITDPRQSQVSETLDKTWVKISLDNKELGYAPRIYLTYDDRVRSIVEPPACPQ